MGAPRAALLAAALVWPSGAGQTAEVLRGCGVPVEQVRLVLPGGDVAAAGEMQVAFIGGSDAVRVRWRKWGSGDAFHESTPRRVEPYHGFDDKFGQRLFNVAVMSQLTEGKYLYEIVDDPSGVQQEEEESAAERRGRRESANERESATPNARRSATSLRDGLLQSALNDVLRSALSGDEEVTTTTEERPWCASAKATYSGEFTFGLKGESLRVAVLGDMGANNFGGHDGCLGGELCFGATKVKEMVGAAADDLDAVFNIGDIAYAAGVDARWEDYGAEIEETSRRVPWMTAVGNHEWGPDANCECGTPYAFRFPMPTNGGAGIDFDAHRKRICHTSVHAATRSGCPFAEDARAFTWQDMAYSLDLGDARMVVVSTAHGIMPGSGQFEWLRRTLSTNPKRWQVVMGHIDECWPCDPLRDVSNSSELETCHCWPHGGAVGEYGAISMGVVQRLMARERLPVDLVLAGHTHEYYLRNCTDVPVCESSEQAPLVVVGGAGYGEEDAPGDAGQERGSQCSRAPYGFVELTFGDDALKVNFRAVPGTGAEGYAEASCRPSGPDACPDVPEVVETGNDRCTPDVFTVVKGGRSARGDVPSEKYV